MSQPEITQRDMRQRSKEIMDAVEGGQSFTVTRDGHLILRRRVDVAELPNEMAISAVTLAELSAGLHQVRPNSEQDTYDEHAERARRLDVLQRAEHEFDPIPFGAEAARTYGRVAAAVVSAGRKPRPRIADLMIAATAIVESLPLFTTNPDDFDGLLGLLTVVPVTRPLVSGDGR